MKHVKIVINGRFLTQKVTGINRFAYELCKEIIKQGLEIIIVAPKNTEPCYQLNCPIIKYGILQGPLWEQIDLPAFLLKNGTPMLLNFSGLGPIFYKNQIVTIHDLAFLANPQWYSKSYYWYYKITTPILAKCSKRILTVSNFSKNEIVNYLNIPAKTISVIYNAVSINLNTKNKNPDLIDGKYILCVASHDPRKNLSRLLEAYLQSQIAKEYQLVFAGKQGKIFKHSSSAELENRSLGYVSDKDLVSLYNNASLFVYPSLYEGFGIPPLEAMSLGCPVIISDIPVFKEIFGNAGFFVNPYKVSEIQTAMETVLSDEKIRNAIIEKGFEQAAKYSWADSASTVIRIIQESYD